MVTMVDKSTKPLNQHMSLIAQFDFREGEAPDEFSFRYLHAFFTGNTAMALDDTLSRYWNRTLQPDFSDALILKYKYAPWPEVQDRLTQVGARIPESDVALGRGVQHTYLMSNATRAQHMYEEAKTRDTLDLLDIQNCENCSTKIMLTRDYCVSCQLKDTVTKLFA